MNFTLVRRGRKAYIATDLDEIIATFDRTEDAKMVMGHLAAPQSSATYQLFSSPTTRGTVAMLCQKSVVEQEGFRCLATGSADSLKKLVEALSAT